MKKSNFKLRSKLLFVGVVVFFCQNIIAGSKEIGCGKLGESSKCSSSFKPKHEKETKVNKTVLQNRIRRPGAKIVIERTSSVLMRAPLPKSYTSVYDYLTEPGNEKPGYGLYSYIIFPHYSPRTLLFLQEFFKTVGFVNQSRLSPKNLNLIYIPIQGDKPKLSGVNLSRKSDFIRSVSIYTENNYDYAMGRAFLAQICKEPADKVRRICGTDLSGGPYLFTYTRPASSLPLVEPPYLFVDLSKVHNRAFGEFIAAYKAQIKRTDYTDLKRINNLRLRMLNIVLTAADLISPMKDAIADILYMVKGKKENNSSSSSSAASTLLDPKVMLVGGITD